MPMIIGMNPHLTFDERAREVAAFGEVEDMDVPAEAKVLIKRAYVKSATWI